MRFTKPYFGTPASCRRGLGTQVGSRQYLSSQFTFQTVQTTRPTLGSVSRVRWESLEW